MYDEDVVYLIVDDLTEDRGVFNFILYICIFKHT